MHARKLMILSTAAAKKMWNVTEITFLCRKCDICVKPQSTDSIFMKLCYGCTIISLAPDILNVLNFYCTLDTISRLKNLSEVFFKYPKKENGHKNFKCKESLGTLTGCANNTTVKLERWISSEYKAGPKGVRERSCWPPTPLPIELLWLCTHSSKS